MAHRIAPARLPKVASMEQCDNTLLESSEAWKAPCKFFKKTTGTCKFGETCKFYHPTTATQPQAAEINEDFMCASEEGGRAQDRDEKVKLCTAWINTGSCPRASACKLRHGTCGVAIGKARAKWIEERRQRRAALPSTPGDDVPTQDKLGYRARGAVMASWMANTFRHEDLEKGILDVAGGRGDLSFELSLAHSFTCTVVDPRPIRLNKFQHRRLSQALVTVGVQNSRSTTTGSAGAEVIEAAQRRQQVLETAKALRAQGKVEEAVIVLRKFASTARVAGGLREEEGTQGLEMAEAGGEGGKVAAAGAAAGAAAEDDCILQTDPTDESNNEEEVTRAFEQRDCELGDLGEEGAECTRTLAAALRLCKVRVQNKCRM